MDKERNKIYDEINSNSDERVVKMVPITQIDTEQKGNKVKVSINKEKPHKKKRSALEISDAIGVYGAFGRTLSDLHKQGK